jgi:TetR/AcrR family transcriptional repressor of nem operon
MRNPSETRDRLLETAVELVWQSNYCSVGVAEICKRAGVTKGAFYHHFDSKADLFYAAAQHHRDSTRGEWDAIFDPELPPLTQFERLIEHLLLDGREELGLPPSDSNAPSLEVNGCPFFSAGSQVGVEETKVRLAAVEMAEDAVRQAGGLVRALRDGGYLDGDPDPEQTGRMAFTFVQGLLLYGRAHNSRAAVEADLRDGLYRILGLKTEYRRESVLVAEQAEPDPILT